MNLNDINQVKKNDVVHLQKIEKIQDFETNILFNNMLELIWSRFFTKLEWSWTYNKKNKYQFKLKINEMEINAKIIDTDDYNELVKEYSLINGFRQPFLILGNKIQDFWKIEEQIKKNVKEKKFKWKGKDVDQKGKTKDFGFSKYIGLIGYKLMGGIANSIVFLYKDKKTNKYSIGWVYEELNLALDLSKLKEQGVKFDYMIILRVNSKYHFEKKDCEELDKIWQKVLEKKK